MSKFVKVPLILSIMTVLCSGLLMLSESLTREKIEQQKKQVLLASLEQLIPKHLHDNDLTKNAIEIFDTQLLGHRSTKTAYIGTLAGETTVVALPATSRNGYSGDIDIMVGIQSNGEITSVKILEQHETPGLGDLIEADKSDWIQQFPKQSLSRTSIDQWSVKRDGGTFDQITGATISPRAVTDAVKNALLYHKQHYSNVNSTSQHSQDSK